METQRDYIHEVGLYTVTQDLFAKSTESICVHMIHFASYFTLSIPCTFLQSIRAPTN